MMILPIVRKNVIAEPNLVCSQVEYAIPMMVVSVNGKENGVMSGVTFTAK